MNNISYYNKYLKYKMKYYQSGGFNIKAINVQYMSMKDFICKAANDKHVRDEFEEILNDHRNSHNGTILNIVDEYFESKKSNPNSETNIIYLTYENKIIAIGRIIYELKGYINMINVNKNMRGNKICNFLIEKIIKMTKKYYNINEYLLHVEKNNIPAIKCYESIGFKITRSNNEYNEFVMELLLN